MRKTLKFLHTMAAIGFTGGLAALLVLHSRLPEPSELEQFATLRLAMGAVAQWILFPSMGLVLVSGLLAMAVTPSFQDRAWVWAKLATGILVFEGTLAYVQAPMERAAARAQRALDGEIPWTELGATLRPEWGSFWVILGVAVANVVLGVWRPRFSWGTSGGTLERSVSPPTLTEDR
ncbi:MAG: hypothetical protein P8188_09020 [Gemmatimonadota bacterium]|jgi:uncharacterized membrane protein